MAMSFAVLGSDGGGGGGASPARATGGAEEGGVRASPRFDEEEGVRRCREEKSDAEAVIAEKDALSRRRSKRLRAEKERAALAAERRA